MNITNRIGPPVEGDDFYGRQRELKIANRLLEAGNSLLLAAPRRIGKSSFAKKLIAEKIKDGWKCVYIDLEEISTEEHFLKTLIEAFDEKSIWKSVSDATTDAVRSFLGRIKSVKIKSIGIDLYQSDNKIDLYRLLKDSINHEAKTLIVVDELTLFLNSIREKDGGVEKIRLILDWLRSIRQISGTQVRWLFAGSVGLNNFAKRNNLSHSINDLTEMPLGELDEPEAKELLTLLLQSLEMNFHPDVVDYTIEKLYWNIPYFIQLLVSKLSTTVMDETIRQSDVDSVYTQLTKSDYLSTWVERLVEYSGERQSAMAILKLMCQAKDGITRKTLLPVYRSLHEDYSAEDADTKLSELLNMLENDGYITMVDGRRFFRSPLLRDYWNVKYCSD